MVDFAKKNDGFADNPQVPYWRKNLSFLSSAVPKGPKAWRPEKRLPYSQIKHLSDPHEKPKISTKIAAGKLYQFVDDTSDKEFKETYMQQISDNLDVNQKLDLKSELLNLVNISLWNRQYEVFDKLVELMLNKEFSSEQLSSFRDSENNNIALVFMDALDSLCQEYLSLPERAEFENLSSEQMEEQEVDLSIALGNLVERIDRASEKPKIADLQKVIAQAQQSEPFNLLKEAQQGLVQGLHSSLQKIKQLNDYKPNRELTDGLRVIGEAFKPYLQAA